MNLIGHYTCAAVPSAAVRVGSVLPDLVALYRRKVRPLALARQWREAAGGARDDAFAGLLAGVDFHHAVDVRFHRAPLFESTAGALQEALLDASRTPGLKRFLPAHVLSELYLDHLLLRRDPGLADAFYRDVDGARALLTKFVARHPQADGPSFGAFLERIVDGRFVDAYRSHEGILERMNRILVRFGQRPLEEVEQEAVAAWFASAVGETEQALQAFLHAMHGLAPAAAAGADAPHWRAAAADRWADGRLSPQFA